MVKYYTDKYGPDSPQVQKCESGVRFEPSIAEKIFDEMVMEQKPRITVFEGCRFQSAETSPNSVISMTTYCPTDKSSFTFAGPIFIDASYEGDLLAGVRVPYHVGREGRNEFKESLAGVSVGPDKGKADKLIMAYNYRLCLTSTPGNVVLFLKPEQYDPSHWARIYGPRIKSGKLTSMGELFWSDPSIKVGPNGKYDDNSTDLMGGSTDYPDGNGATRDAII